MKALSGKSAWSEARVEKFLLSDPIPLRVAVQTESGFPLLCSLWFSYHKGKLLCATQRDAKLVRHLEVNSACAFELAPNEPPYFGVRGHGHVEVTTEGAEEQLEKLIDRYLGDRESSLAKWLLGRAHEEVKLVIEPVWLTSWDYSERMEGSATR